MPSPGQLKAAYAFAIFCLCLACWCAGCSKEKKDEPPPEKRVDLLYYLKDYSTELSLSSLQGSGLLTHRLAMWNTFLNATDLSADSRFTNHFNPELVSLPWEGMNVEGAEHFFMSYAPFKGFGGQVYAEERIPVVQRNAGQIQKQGRALLTPWLFISDLYIGAAPEYAAARDRGIALDGSDVVSATFISGGSEPLPRVEVLYRYVPHAIILSDVNARLIADGVRLKGNNTIAAEPINPSYPTSREQKIFNLYGYIDYGELYYVLGEDRIASESRFNQKLVDTMQPANNFWHDFHNISTKTAFWIKLKPLSALPKGAACGVTYYCSSTNMRGFNAETPEKHYALPELDFELYQGAKPVLAYSIRYQAFYMPPR